MENRRMGYMTTTFRLLEDVIGLPEDHQIHSIWLEMQDRFTKTFQIVIEGPSLPEVIEGQKIPLVDVYIGEVERCSKCGHTHHVVSFREAENDG